LPATGHRIPLLRRTKDVYNGQGYPLINENDTVSLGLVGSAGFLGLLAVMLLRGRCHTEPQLADGLAILNLAAILLGSVGGFGPLATFLGLTWIRGYNRISVYIAFFALFAVALVLQQAVRRWAGSDRGKMALAGLLALLLVGGILDQTNIRQLGAYEQ